MKDTQYRIAISLALKWHAGQKYGDSDKDYMYHLLNVSRIATKRYGWDDNLAALCILHDILEDTDCTVQDLDSAGVNFKVIEAVCVITKVEGQTYSDYIFGCGENELALKGKLCDTMTNLEHSFYAGAHKRIKKYSNQLGLLSEMEKNNV